MAKESNPKLTGGPGLRPKTPKKPTDAPMDPETIAQILRDIQGKIPPNRSSLKYTGAMEYWRRQQEAEWAAHLVDHPGDVISIPEETPHQNIPSTFVYGMPGSTRDKPIKAK